MLNPPLRSTVFVDFGSRKLCFRLGESTFLEKQVLSCRREHHFQNVCFACMRAHILANTVLSCRRERNCMIWLTVVYQDVCLENGGFA